MWFRMEANGSTLGGSSQVDGAITNYIITGLLPVTNYSVTIYAINGRGKGVGSKEQTTLTLPSGERAVFSHTETQRPELKRCMLDRLCPHYEKALVFP